MTEEAKNVKVVLLGDGGVGKTSIVNSYFRKPFQGSYKMTLGTEFRIKRVGNHVIQIWDLAGQPIFSSVRSTYYVGALGAILVYDVTKKSTYDNIPNWLEEFYYHKGENVPIILVANKIDLRDIQACLTAEDGQKLKEKLEASKKFKVTYVESSAKTSHNIDDIFDKMVDRIVSPELSKTEGSTEQSTQSDDAQVPKPEIDERAADSSD
ncbi:MAG: GTP-binding protein [Candidatus Kariarchaeaceae archaeon]|jgi:small GTP-binding protein